MKNKILKTIFPTLLGIFAVLGLLMLFNLIVHNGRAFNSPDNGFFSLFVPIIIIIAMIIQFFLVLPFLEKFKSQKKKWGLTIFQFTIILCIISGVIFGLVCWERSFGINELIFLSITGIVAFLVYWLVNFLTLKQLNK